MQRSYNQNRQIARNQNRAARAPRRNQLARTIANAMTGINPVITYPFPTPRTTTNSRRTRRRNTNFNRQTYTNIVRAPAAVGMVVESANSSPMTSFSGTNYVFDVPSSTSFSSYSWFMHPINIPFLKEQANLFSRYQFVDLKYRIVTVAPTNMSGQHWSGYQMRSHEIKPADLNEAQYLQSFHLAPIWKSDSHFTQVDRAVLQDRWYSTAQFASAIDPQLTPGYIYFGTGSMASDQPNINVGMLEIAYRIQFRDRRLPKGTQLNEHNLAAQQVIRDIKTLHSGSSDHNKAVNIRLKALLSEETDTDSDPIHRAAVLEIAQDIRRHCKAQGGLHAGLSDVLLDQFYDLHENDEAKEEERFELINDN